MRKTYVCIYTLLFCALVAATAMADNLGKKIPDIVVKNQLNKNMSFYQDLVRGKTVAINFVYTNCKTACPMQAATFSKLQDLLKDRLGKDVYLISVSIDPLEDTPSKLNSWSSKFGRKKGWELVTGKKADITRLLKAVDMFTAVQDEHSPIILLGNDSSGTWQRVNGLSSPSKLLKILDKLTVTNS